MFDDQWTLLQSTMSTPTTTPSPISNQSITTNTTSSSTTESPIIESTESVPITLALRRYQINAILDEERNEIYIFGGGGCSTTDDVCSPYRNLVEIFDAETYRLRTDDALLLSAASDSFSSLYYHYDALSTDSQAGSWFDGIFVIGGNTEKPNGTVMVQYRVTDYMIVSVKDDELWHENPWSIVLLSMIGMSW